MSIVDQKTPGEILDFGWDYSDQLTPGDVINGSIWEVSVELNVISQGYDSTAASFFASGGAVGDFVSAKNRAVTEQGRTFERTLYIQIVAEKNS
ncbi:MAG: hypothetical protein JMN25_18085 [gamma proteobacterium endosymbiont of Lamellibrachia anaximandri]|nr:hypothetical protein [gamma proteobacterium endosymbiont of Lamellibrachia anaximandri]